MWKQGDGRQGDREKGDRETVRQGDRETGRQGNRETGRETVRQGEGRQGDSKTGRQAGRRQTGRHGEGRQGVVRVLSSSVVMYPYRYTLYAKISNFFLENIVPSPHQRIRKISTFQKNPRWPP